HAAGGLLDAEPDAPARVALVPVVQLFLDAEEEDLDAAGAAPLGVLVGAQGAADDASTDTGLLECLLGGPVRRPPGGLEQPLGHAPAPAVARGDDQHLRHPRTQAVGDDGGLLEGARRAGHLNLGCAAGWRYSTRRASIHPATPAAAPHRAPPRKAPGV